MVRLRWVLIAGLALGTGAAHAQKLPPYAPGGVAVASDFDAPPYPGPDLSPGYGPLRSHEGPRYAPAVLGPIQIYDIVRNSGYSPLGIPQQRGFVYTIAAINLDGDDGRLVIDARSGRILRFMPAYRMGSRMSEETVVSYGPRGPLPPIAALERGPPRPPASVPRVASRTPAVPLPKSPPRAVAVAPQPAPAVGVTKPADAQASIAAPAPVAPAPVVEAKPAVQPTQDMPAVQALE